MTFAKVKELVMLTVEGRVALPSILLWAYFIQFDVIPHLYRRASASPLTNRHRRKHRH